MLSWGMSCVNNRELEMYGGTKIAGICVETRDGKTLGRKWIGLGLIGLDWIELRCEVEIEAGMFYIPQSSVIVDLECVV